MSREPDASPEPNAAPGSHTRAETPEQGKQRPAARPRLVAAIVVAALVFATGFALRPATPSLPSDPTGDEQLIAAVRDFDPPGHRLAVVVVEGGDAGGQVRSAYWDAGPDTAFEIGSVSKAVTGLAIADAVQRGELTLDDPLGEHLDLAESPAADLPLSELVTHHSGLPRVPGGASEFLASILWIMTGSNPYSGDVADLEASAREADIGEKQFQYSNLGTALAGQAAAAAAGLSYPDYINERVSTPLGLSDTAVQWDQPLVDKGLDESGRSQEQWVMDGDAPAGAIVSTPHDLTLLAEALLAGTAPGQSALEPLADTDTDGTQIGTFWFTDQAEDGRPAHTWHNGATGGYSSYLALDRDNDRAVIVLADVTSTATGIGRHLLEQQNGDRP